MAIRYASYLSNALGSGPSRLRLAVIILLSAVALAAACGGESVPAVSPGEGERDTAASSGEDTVGRVTASATPRPKIQGGSGKLSVGRQEHTATLLNDGTVVLIGGCCEFSKVRHSEVYDPDQMTWTVRGSLNEMRWNQTATLLESGDVLIAGGAGEEQTLSSAELYDPGTGDFTNIGDMMTPRVHHGAVRLPDGRVFLVGGYARDQEVLTSAEVYDPDTGTFTAAGEMERGRKDPGVVLLQDGRVLVAGGCRNRNFPCTRRLRFAEIWDPETGEFTETARLNESHWGHTVTAMPDGRVLLVGGFIDNVARGTAELYDPVSDTWKFAGGGGSRFWHTATLLRDGRVLVVGGARNIGASMNAETYITASDAFSFVEDMKRPRALHTTTLLDDGRVLIVGGGESLYNPDPWLKKVSDTAEIFDPATGAFTSADSTKIEQWEPPLRQESGEVQRQR